MSQQTIISMLHGLTKKTQERQAFCEDAYPLRSATTHTAQYFATFFRKKINRMLEQSQKKRVKMSQISEALKYQREIAGLSQTELAKKTKLSQQAISLWEHDERAPNINACIVLADFYGISLDELVGRDYGKLEK